MLAKIIPGASRLTSSRTLRPPARLALLVLCAFAVATGIEAQTDFTMTPTAPTPGSLATFTFSGPCPGSLTSVIWEFGDNTTITLNPGVQGCNATHAYASAGIYRVRLRVLPGGASMTRDLGVRTTANGQNSLNAGFSWAPELPSPGQITTFADETTPLNSVGQWLWEFDDGSSSYLSNPDKTFPTGIHGVRLTVRNQVAVQSVLLYVEVQLPAAPTAAFSFTPAHPAPGAEVKFFDESTGKPTSWSWNFGDPTSIFPNTSTDQNPTRRYMNPGAYTVRLIATNGGGPSEPHSEVVTVGQVGPLPVASFIYSPAAPVTGDQVLFTDTSTGSPTSWSWNFDDPASGGSNTSALRNPSHVFTEVRSYNVTLRATNTNGTSDPAVQAVAVGQPQTNCHPNANTLCLQGNRFSVTSTFRTRTGETGSGFAQALTVDSGYFYFFNVDNIEVVTKVLRACSNPFNSFWVFGAGLTDVEVTLTVTDTNNGTVKTYHNPLGTPFQPIQDTSAFATCP